MSKYTRGEFLGFGAALAGAFTVGRVPGARALAQTAAAQPAAGAGAEPDLIVVNARVLTSDTTAHRGGHTNFYNSKAFELAGITADTPDPPDGRFFKENGELNGRVAENARNVFNRVGKRETFTPEQRRDRARKGMAHMSQLFNAAGLTSVHNAGTSQEHILAYEDCRRNGELTHRAYMMIRSPQAYNGLKAANIHTGFGDEW